MAEGMTLEEQAEVAKEFLEGLLDTYGFEGTVRTRVIDEETVEVAADGEGLGLLVGPKGSTLAALQDVTRTVVQRRCPSRTDRILVDVAGYREKRSAALQRFSQQVAADVIESGNERALEPMSPADRKVVHDAINEIDGVVTRFDGEDPHRHVVIAPGGLTRITGHPRRAKACTEGRAAGAARGAGGARQLGLLGPGPLQGQIDHARGFAWAVGRRGDRDAGTVLDLGSGGGLPGLVLASPGRPPGSPCWRPPVAGWPSSAGPSSAVVSRRG